jgi:hypothetical protein
MGASLRHPRRRARPGRRPPGPDRPVGHQGPRVDRRLLRRGAGRAGRGAAGVAPRQRDERHCRTQHTQPLAHGPSLAASPSASWSSLSALGTRISWAFGLNWWIWSCSLIASSAAGGQGASALARRCRRAEGGTPDPCHRDHPARPTPSTCGPSAQRSLLPPWLPPGSSWWALAGHRRRRLTATRRAAAGPRLAPRRRCPGRCGGRCPAAASAAPWSPRCP